MAPKSPWNKKATTRPKAPKNDAAEPAGSAAINYGEMQDEEIDVLEAIYMEDYEEVELKSAWNTTTDRSFKLKLRSFSDPEACVYLSVRLTATYPKTTPLLDVQGLDRYHERTQSRIGKIVEKRPKELLGEVMIHTIANEIQEALEDAVQARQQGALPSLEDERASAEEVATVVAKRTQEAEDRRQQEAQEEEARVLHQMVEDEITRREKRKPAKTANDDPSKGNDSTQSQVITFDRSASIQTNNESFIFNQVAILSLTSSNRNEQSFLAKPHVDDHNIHSRLVAVKRITFQKTLEEIMELEANLAVISKLRHPGLLNVFAYRIDRLSDVKSELIICEEYADRGTLRELLEASTVHVGKARQLTVELLEALEYLHHHGMAHGRLVARNVSVESTSGMRLKLANFGYPWTLHDENDRPTQQWPAPEYAESASSAALRKSDIWQFGTIVCQMFLGAAVLSKYSSPQVLLNRLDLSDSFDAFLRKVFVVDSKKRPSAFDLLTAEFLRTDNPVMGDGNLAPIGSLPARSRDTGSFASSPWKRRSRHSSSNALEPMSRYANDFTELGRLGSGGFGAVVKARNKLDGGVYAIKKIKQAAQLLDQVVSEVMLLNRLNHPYVVRYFSTWIEQDWSGSAYDTSETETETATDTRDNEESSDVPRLEFGYQSTGGLDFISSSGFPQIEFGNDSDDDSSDEDADAIEDGTPDVQSAEISQDGDRQLRKTRSDSKKIPSTLYIQMEYCERHTLRDLIRKTMTLDATWQYVRQITEGLAHIHGHGIIHRDLKPDNVFIDVAGNPKIGDFGLATTAQQQLVDRAVGASHHSTSEMTRSVGTTLYVAPELRSGSGQSYNDKVDMYSLGIMFYEMCEPFSTGMERIKALQKIREKEHELPTAYQSYGAKAAQGRIISKLISYKPAERPSSTELLRSDMLPVQIEDETIRKALSGLADSRSPYHLKVMSALFAHDTANELRIKALAWDARSPNSHEDTGKLRLRNVARQTLEGIFRRHGGEESRRQSIFPKSANYSNTNAVQLLDASGNLLQLPFDLVLPHARQLARHRSDPRFTFSFGSAYRDAYDGGPPRISDEVDFDITNSDDSDEHAFNDAEVIKVMDEIMCEMPLFASSTTTSFHLNHSSIVDAVLRSCRVPAAQQTAVKEFISRLGFNQYSWSKVRAELRRFGLPDTTLDDLVQFDFRDAPEKTFTRLRTLLSTADSQTQAMLDTGIMSLNATIHILSMLNIRRKIYVAPLGSVNAKFYEDGILIQCVLERKSNRLVIAAGGRYDSLIQACRPPDTRYKPQGCVGVSIGLDSIITGMARNNEGTGKRAYLKNPAALETPSKRCDVLVSASGSEETEGAGIRLLTTLWASGISAEIGSNQIARSKEHNFVVAVKHGSSLTVRVTNASAEGEEADIAISSLTGYLQQELRDLQSTRVRQQQPALLRQPSQPETERKSNVQVLLARHGSKKSNKYQIVSDAQESWFRKLEGAKNAPILAVETRDDVCDVVQQTRFSDAESWRRAVQSVQLNDRQYVQQIHDLLASWRKEWEEGTGTREACVFNFRTQRCMYYDLGA